MSNKSHPKRVHKPAEEREADILAAATKVFAERGYQVADMQSVADTAGVGKGTVYRYFSSKEALFTAVIKFNLDRLTTQVNQARAAPDDPLAQLREAMRAHLVFFENNPEVIELLVQERVQLGGATDSLYFVHMLASRHEWVEWVELFEKIAATYCLRAVDIEEAMAAYGDLVHGAVILDNSPIPRKPLSQRFDSLFDIYLHGILRQPIADTHK